MIALVAAVGCGDDEATSEAPASSMLFLAGDGELWAVDAVSGSDRHFEMSELSPGDPPHRIASRGDRLVLWGYDTLSLDPEHPDQSPDRIARGSLIWIPSMHPDRVWVGYPDPENRQSSGLASVEEIDATGDVTVPGASPPQGAWPEVALDAGLVFGHRDDVLELWDPRSQEVVRRIPRGAVGDLGPAHGNQLASCIDACTALVLTDFTTGEQRSIPAPDGHTFEIWHAAFSPDGATIATPIREVGRGDDPTLALVSLDSGDVSLVPGSKVPSPYTFALWASDGGEVYLAGGGSDGGAVLVAYSPAEDELRRMPLDAGPFYDAAALETTSDDASTATTEPAARERKPGGLSRLEAFLDAGRSTDGPAAVVGHSAMGEPIRAFAIGGLGGAQEERVLVFGCIHGTECAGKAVAEALHDRLGYPPVNDVIAVPNLNPDGLAAQSRLNSRGVDLNRNFDAGWRLAGRPGDPEYSGPRPFSEPETRLARRLIERLRPDITIWFHQQAESLVRAWGPSVATAREYAAHARMSFHRLPWLPGTAPNWQNHAFPDTSSFVVELPTGPISRRAAWRPAVAIANLGGSDSPLVSG